MEENSGHAFWHRFAAHPDTHVLVRALRRCWAWPDKAYQTWGTSSIMQRSQNHPESIMLGKTTEILNPTYNQAPPSLLPRLSWYELNQFIKFAPQSFYNFHISKLVSCCPKFHLQFVAKGADTVRGWTPSLGSSWMLTLWCSYGAF